MELIHVGFASVTVTTICLGCVALGKGIQYGLAGAVEAIENAKVIL